MGFARFYVQKSIRHTGVKFNKYGFRAFLCQEIYRACALNSTIMGFARFYVQKSIAHVREIQ